MSRPARQARVIASPVRLLERVEVPSRGSWRTRGFKSSLCDLTETCAWNEGRR
jgi:hypothetical protein